MYTHKILDKGINNVGALTVKVEFTNEDNSLVIPYTFNGIVSLDDLKTKVQSQLDFYNLSEQVKENIPDMEVDLTPVVVETPVQTPVTPPTQFYPQKRQELIQAKQDLDLGLIQQADYDALLQETIALKS